MKSIHITLHIVFELLIQKADSHDRLRKISKELNLS